MAPDPSRSLDVCNLRKLVVRDGPRADDELIARPVAAVDDVGQRQIGDGCVDDVIAGTAVDDIVAAIAGEGVSPTVADKYVVARAAGENVIAGPAVDVERSDRRRLGSPIEQELSAGICQRRCVYGERLPGADDG